MNDAPLYEIKKGGKYYKFFKYHDSFHKSMLGRNVLLASSEISKLKIKNFKIEMLGPPVTKENSSNIFAAYFPVIIRK